MRRVAILALGLLLLLNACGGKTVVEQDGDQELPASGWVMADHDAQHTNRSEFAGPVNPRVKWTYTLESGPVAVSTIAADGRLYATCGRLLLAFDELGEVLWRAESNRDYNTAPVVGADGMVYTGGELLRAYTPDGALAWYVVPTGGEFGEPAVAADGVVYAVAGGDTLYLVGSNGEFRWAYTLAGEAQHPPLVDGEGRVYLMSIAGDWHVLTVLAADGFLWQIQEEECELSIPALGPEGQLYVGLYDESLFEPGTMPSDLTSELVAFYPDGSRAWSHELHGGLSSKILVTPDGMVYTTSRESSGSLYAFTSDGELVLEEMFGGWTSMELVSVANDGRAYVTVRDCDWGIPSHFVYSTDGTSVPYEVADRVDPQPPLSFGWDGASVGVHQDTYVTAVEFRNADQSLRWQYQPGSSGGQVLLSPDGGIVLARSKVQKYSREGQLVWTYSSGLDWTRCPAIGSDGTIYLLGSNHHTDGMTDELDETAVLAVSADGTEIWRTFIATDRTANGPIISPDGRLYVTTGSRLMAFTLDGEQPWEFDTGCEYVSNYVAPGIAPDGTVYFANEDADGADVLFAINRDGSEKWRCPYGGDASAILVGDDGTVLVVGCNALTAISPTGNLLRELSGGPLLFNRFAVLADGTVCFSITTWTGQDDGSRSLRVLGSDGQWLTERQIDLGDGLFAGNLIADSAGRLYVGVNPEWNAEDEEKASIGIDAYSATGELQWHYTTGAYAGGLAIGADGTLYFTGDGRIYALGD